VTAYDPEADTDGRGRDCAASVMRALITAAIR
jgi:hypothetical protein